MHIIVCIKQTFDTEEILNIVNGSIREEGVKFVMNPYDEYALEEALRLKDAFGGEVTVVTIGPARVESALRSALAVGADRAVWVESDGGEDERSTARKLAAAVRKRPYDLLLCGNMAVDTGAGQGGPRLAEELGIPHVAAVLKLDIEPTATTALAERDAEGGKETVQVPLPALFTAQQGLNEPRYPTLPGIMKAKKKPLERLGAAELGLPPGDAEPRTACIGRSKAAKREGGRKLPGSPAEQAAELARLLTEESKLW